MDPDHRSHIETELTLVVCDDLPEQVCREIEALTLVGGLQAGDAQVQRIHDRYYDTPKHGLRSAGWGLRIRRVGAGRVLALKGRSRMTDYGAVERTEIEGQWSLPLLEAALEQLPWLGLTGGAAEVFDLSSADATLTRLGFLIIQDRETVRKTRTLTRAPASTARSDAELVVDRVVYSFEGIEFVHHEIEIEALSSSAAGLIPFVHEDLAKRFGDSVRVWPHSKLATGWALKRLLAEGCTDSLVKNGFLLPAAYNVIHETLAREPFPHS